MSSTEIGIEEARKRLGDLVIDAQHGTPITITRHGKPAAILIPAIPQIREAFERVGVAARNATDSLAPVIAALNSIAKETDMPLRTHRQPHVHLQWTAQAEAWAGREGRKARVVEPLTKPMAKLVEDGFVRLTTIEGDTENRYMELTEKGIADLDADLLQQVIDDGNANKRAHNVAERDITAEQVLEFYRTRA